MASNVIEERELRNTLRRLVRRQVVYGEKQTRKRGDFLDGPGVSASNAGGTISVPRQLLSLRTMHIQ